MTLTRIEHILTKSIGLDPLSIGHSTIRRAVVERMGHVSVASMQQYASLLSRSNTELEALLEGVTVPETWFFRDPAAYEFLASYVQSHHMVQKPGQRLKILSLPCSTGEEPYSIAMTLALAGLSNYSILAIDIRHAALCKARQGLYGRGSFRGPNLEFRDTFFEASEKQYRLSPRIASKVEFRCGNLLDPLLLAGEGTFDLVFCRNLLIYLDATSRMLASTHVDRWLDDEGILFSGHAETSFAWGERFASLRQPRAFVYRKNPDVPALMSTASASVVPIRSRMLRGGGEK